MGHACRPQNGLGQSEVSNLRAPSTQPSSSSGDCRLAQTALTIEVSQVAIAAHPRPASPGNPLILKIK